jgi:hypothetical protein
MECARASWRFLFGQLDGIGARPVEQDLGRDARRGDPKESWGVRDLAKRFAQWKLVAQARSLGKVILRSLG